MNAFVVFLTLATLAIALPSSMGRNIISTYNAEGVLVSEDLDEPTAETQAVDLKNLHFMLFTKSNKDTPYELFTGDTNNLKNSKFNPDKPTKFLIHGWQGSYEGEHVQIVKNAFLESFDVNVIMADYKTYNNPYNTACNNAKPMAAFFGKFIDYLVANGLRLKDLHIIGHSLGAHISGFTANAVTGTVPRITGMDPAGPNFGGDTNPADKLSPDDASYVDVLHTSTAFGMAKATGTADFYPNGGENQPECSGLMSGGCDHNKSCAYYAKSLTSPKAFPARKCNSESDARQKNPSASVCVPSTAYMGEAALASAPAGIYHVAP